MKIIITLIFQVFIWGLTLAQLPPEPLMIRDVDLSFVNTMCDETLPIGYECTRFYNRGLLHPLPIQVLHENNLFSAEAFFGDLNDVQGSIIQKLDIETGDVLWQNRFDFNTYDSSFQEKPIALHVLSGQVVLISYQKTEEYDPNGFNFPLTFYLFHSDEVNLVRRIIDIDSGDLISENIINADQFPNGTNGDSDFSQAIVPVDQDQFIVLKRTNSSDSLNLGFDQTGVQFRIEQTFPFGNYNSLSQLGSTLGITNKSFGYNFYLNEDLIYYYEKVENRNDLNKYILIELYQKGNPIEQLIHSYQLNIEETDFGNAVIKYADSNKFIIQIIDDNISKYYLVKNDGIILQSFRIMHNGADLSRVIFSKFKNTDQVIGMGTTVEDNLGQFIFTKISDQEFSYLDTLQLKDEFYTFSPSNLEVLEDKTLISGQYSFFDINGIQDSWITNFTFGSDVLTSSIELDIFSSLSLYPNPIQDSQILHINNLERKNQFFEYSIIDFSGKIISNGVLNPDNQIDVSSLKTGIFILNLVTDYGIISKRFVKL